MPSFNFLKTSIPSPTNGLARKSDAEMIMEATWYEDIATRTCYFYDWYHDDHKNELNDLKPQDDVLKIPMDVKFIVSSSQTYEKDPITYHLQLKPSQKMVVPYYNKVFANRYGAHFPCGLYVDIPDSKGQYNRWLVVAEANYNDPQFPTYQVLRCDFILQYIFRGTKYEVPVVLRSQNSYNSGIWTDYKFTQVEDQQKLALPLNRDTENIYYDQRVIIDNRVLSEPRTWKVTKVNRIGNNGLATITFAQTVFNAETDFIELDKNGEVIGMWADYYSSTIEPVEVRPKAVMPNINAIILHAGNKPEMKIGGNYKKFTVHFYDGTEEIDYRSGSWQASIDGIDDVSDLISASMDGVEPNQIKLKFVGDDSYIGRILTVTFTSSDGITTSKQMELVAL